MNIENSDKLISIIKKVWDWNSFYWYPLVETSRNDVIAIDDSIAPNYIPELQFSNFLKSFYQKVYHFTEFDGSEYIETSKLDLGYGFSEKYITDKQLKTIVYWSHEGTITLGGYKIIDEFKRTFPKYKNCICDWGL